MPSTACESHRGGRRQGRDDSTSVGSAGSRVAILLTDGVNNAGEIDPGTAAGVAAAVDVRFYTIGIGAERRGPRRRGGVDFDEEVLRQIAEDTGGQYYHATSSEKLAEIYEEIGRLETTEVTSRIHLEYSERYASSCGQDCSSCLPNSFCDRRDFVLYPNALLRNEPCIRTPMNPASRRWAPCNPGSPAPVIADALRYTRQRLVAVADTRAGTIRLVGDTTTAT